MGPRGRRPLVESEGSDAEVSSAADSPRAVKRARTNVRAVQDSDEDENDAEQDAAESNDEQQDDDDLDDDVEDPDTFKLTRDPYVTGSIVRIACQNFLTYDKVEFRPGPALNMIIGPNGTGKSTIACAIAIGLGFKPQVLGRSPKLSSYIKNNSTGQCWIEIELKGKPRATGKWKNMIVRRELHGSGSEGSDFFIDGTKETWSAVTKRMRELDVQVNNLCTFLPQDRVAAFAAMSQIQLLAETQRAAGHPKLSLWHDQLVEAQREQKKLREDLERQQEKLKRRETKQAESEKEVKQFEQRRELEKKLAVLQLVILYATYNEKREKFEQVKGLRNEAQEQLRELEAANKPFRQSETALSAIVEHFKTLQQQVQRKVKKLSREIRASHEQIKESEQASEKTRDDLDGVAHQERMHRQTIKKLEAEIGKLEKMTEVEPAPVDPRPITEAIAELAKESMTIDGELGNKRNDIHSITSELNRIESDANVRRKRLKDLDSVVKQREEATQKFEPDTWKAVEWLRKNQNHLKGKVWEPARLCVTSKTQDKQVVNLIEGPIPLHAWKHEDYKFMMAEVADKLGLRINGAEIGRDRTPDNSQTRLTVESCKRLGFDCTAIDMLDGPAPVLSWLCDELSIGRIPLQITPKRINEAEMVRVGARQFYTLDGSCAIRMSKYGAKLAQIEQRALKDAKILVAGGNTAKIAALQQELEELHRLRLAKKAEIATLQTSTQDLADRLKVLVQEKSQLEERRKALNKPTQDYKKNKLSLDTKLSELEKFRKRPSQESKREALQKKLMKATTQRLEYVIKLKNSSTELMRQQAQYVDLIVRGLQAEADLAAMKTSSNALDRELNDKQQQVNELLEQVSAAKREAKEAMSNIDEADKEAPEEIKVACEERRHGEDLEVDKLQDEEGTLQAQINMTSNISESALQKYDELRKEIAKLRGVVETAEADLAKSDKDMESIRKLWYPRLQKLVGRIGRKFKAAFDALGVLSDIELGEADDYASWGIKILVSFRDDETLQVLTAQRQSGGERALTTVMYLMSLAELVQSPFALVDEINQGMDARVEREVHNALVKTTCKDDVGQYFLLTPKLLPDLDYHARMKVLVINSGTWLPNDLKLAQVLKSKMIRKRQARGGAVAGPSAVAAH
ncbi:Structural maintenance of chromosomes protein 5 [Microbotryomycetes sp. JL221]|nr:Structural maintenance of chromosomes protein 5 [Microbotryomycetes sp. JL221]